MGHVGSGRLGAEHHRQTGAGSRVRRRAPRIFNGLDRAEAIDTGRIGAELAVALEVAILLVLRALGKVNLLCIALPDLNRRVADRAAGRVEHPAGQVGDLADGRG